MSYHTLAYNASAAAAGASNVDLSVVPDTEVSSRNSHGIFTERYKMLAVSAVGVSITRGRFQVPKWNAVGEMSIINANRALEPPSNPQWDLYLAYPPELPQNEEFQVQLSNNLGAATEQENVILQLAPDDWNQNIPKGELLFVQRATFTLTPTINVWSGGQVLTFSQSLRGGVYAVVGGVVQGTDAVAWRIIFPRNKMYHGRRLRPGGLIQNAIGVVINNQIDPWVMGLGVLGYFHTFELPTIEVLGATAAAITYQVYLWLVRLGEDVSILNQYTG